MKTAIEDRDLHAYVDGQLDAERRRRVEAFLSTRPDKAALVDDYRRQRILLHRLFDNIEDRRIPQSLQSLASQADGALRAGRRIRMGGRAAAICGGTALAVLAVVQSTTNRQPDLADALLDFRRQAIEAHLSLGDTPLTADPAVEGAVLSMPELESIGLMPVARRLISADSGDAMQIVYVDADNTRVTLYMKPINGAQRGVATFSAAEGVGQMFWRNAGVAFSLLGPSDEESLTRIAEAIGDIDASLFSLGDLPLDSAATAAKADLEPIVEGTADPIEVVPAPANPEINGDQTPDETLPATQSRRLQRAAIVET